jgi:AbrB family transcriptional regulator (stage V sporulation protein T)
MKATGIVRKIDDLGRVVIPKEIRRTMRIREGDPLEIYTDSDGTVIFKKYSLIGELANFAEYYVETLAKFAQIPTCVTDKDTVIATSGVSKKETLGKRLSNDVEKFIADSKIFSAAPSGEQFSMLESSDKYGVNFMVPIILEAEPIGSVIFLASEKAPGEIEAKMAEVAADFLAKCAN